MRMSDFCQAGDRITMGAEAAIVAAPCDDKNSGHWLCVTCAEHLPNNLSTEFHTDQRRKDGKPHRLAWLCHKHGPEQAV